MDVTRREAALAALLDAVVVGTVADLRMVPESDPVWDAALVVLRETLASRWETAGDLARALPTAVADDAEARWLLRAVTLWAGAGDPTPASDAGPGIGPGIEAVLEDLPGTGTPLGRFAGHVLVEALIAHARLDVATAVVDALGDDLWTWLSLEDEAHPFGAMAQVCRVRLAAFRGELAEADRALASIPCDLDGAIGALVAGTACLVRGNQADPADVRRLIAVIDRGAPCAVDHLSAGSQMLAAFGLIALGDVVGAARRVLLAGGDAALSRLDVIDRALGLEMLLALALAADDLDAAQTWAHQLFPLTASPIADSTVARAMSRIALAEGRPDDAVAWGERAIARARAVDRVIEYAEGEIVLGRARIAQRGAGGLAAAVRALESMVSEAEQRGHRAARRSASRELRPIGIRLRPLAGSGWAGLSPREAEVARCVAEGASNREIAARLHVSEHTVRAHVSRVLAAFGVATRAALPAVAGAVLGDAGPRPALTPRQVEVAHLVAAGLTNRAISERLGVSARTVEKHVGDILTRWDLPCRTAIAREVSLHTV